MKTDLQQVLQSLQDVEGALQHLSPFLSSSLSQAQNAVAGAEQAVSNCHYELESWRQRAAQALAVCENSGYYDDDGYYYAPNCSAEERELNEAEQALVEIRRLQGILDDAVRSFQSGASRAQSIADHAIPDACYWLEDRQRAIQKAETGSVGYETVAALAPAVISALTNLGGGHGSRYRAARQEFLRSLADDPNQPRYVRGWIKQEMNRLDRIKVANQKGIRPPGGNQRHIYGVPGYDVGHLFPDIDLPWNFRLENASTNRARPGIAKRLGITDLR